MKTKISIMMMVYFVVGLMGVGSAMADAGMYYRARTDMKGMNEMRVSPHNAGNILNMRVTNNQGKALGWVDDLIFSKNGDLIYLIVSSGGLQSSETLKGEGGKLTVIPFDSIRNGFHVSKSWVNIPVSLSEFSTAPTFLRYELSNLQNGKWGNKANAYFK